MTNTNNEVNYFKNTGHYHSLEKLDKNLAEAIAEMYGDAIDRTRQELLSHLISKVEGLRSENEASEDYQTGEHWSTKGYPKALDDVTVLLREQ